MNHSTEKNFDYHHFNAFTQLNNLKQYDMMTSISTFALATACCYIDDDWHLEGVISFMTLEQKKSFKSLINTIQAVPPSPVFVVEVQ